MALDFNTTLQFFQPLLSPITAAINLIQIVLGGLFGLYLLSVLLNFLQRRQEITLLQKIHHDLHRLRKKLLRKKQ